MGLIISFGTPDFENWLKGKGLSDITIKDYLFYSKKFKGREFTQREVLAFLLMYKNNLVVRAFVKNLKEYLLERNVELKLSAEEIAQINDLKVQKITGRIASKVPEVITEEQVLKIHNIIPKEMHRLMLLLTFYCGLRKGELLGIRVNSFNWDAFKSTRKTGELTVFGKGNKERIAYVPVPIMNRIVDYINKRISKELFKENPYLFPSSVWEKHLHPRKWNTLLSEYSKKALDKEITPHQIRHSFGSLLLKRKVDLMHIKELMGHSNISSTQIYLHLSKDEIKDKLDSVIDTQVLTPKNQQP